MFHRHVFHKVPSASHNDVIVRLGHDNNYPQGLALFAGLELDDDTRRLLCRVKVMVKSTVLNSLPPAIHCMGTYVIMVFNGVCAVLSE